MRPYKLYISVILLLLTGILTAFAQKRNDLIIAKDHLILLVDTRSSRSQIDSMLKLAGISGATADMIIKNDFSVAKKEGWNIKKIDENFIQFDRALSSLTNTAAFNPFQITSGLLKSDARPGYPAEVSYGVNSFSRNTVFLLPSGLTRFFVPGNLRAKRVMVSGSFNAWSTLKGVMAKTDSGWVTDIKLEPGIYAYKFIINGNWTVDMYNNIVKEDGIGNANSIYYRYNYTFKLPGYLSSHHVSVGGSFNSWRANEIEMYKIGDSWKRSMYLHDGIFAYRFMVDGDWIADPLNPVTNKDAAGNVKSVLNLGESTSFKLNGYINAQHVYVAGDFNKWKPNDLAMKRDGNGWILPYTLAPGNYGYKFIVDGKWMTDPQNGNTVGYNGETNSFLPVKPNHTFVLKGFRSAKTIRISGNFNDWSEDGYTLSHQGDEWRISLRLKPGKCLYKFIVDGKWIIDPGNKLWEQNEFDTGNSVLWMD